MKKLKNILMFIIISMLIFSNVLAETPTLTEDEALSKAGINRSMVTILKEKMFLTQLYDIYFNYDQYADKYIEVEGMFQYMGNLAGTEDMIPMVYRKSPGCCGDDGWEGFVINYDKDLPEIGQWIRVIGQLKKGQDKDKPVGIYLELIYLEVKEERGAEFVYQ